MATIESDNSSNNKTTPEGDTKSTNRKQSSTTVNVPPKPPDNGNVQVSSTPLHNEYNSDELPDLVLPHTRSVVTSPRTQHTAQSDSGTEQTPKRNHQENMSQPSTTP